MADYVNFLGAIGIFLFGLILLYVGMHGFIFGQKIRNTPNSKVRSASVGLIELHGKAKLKKSILSPISGKKCVYWEVHAYYFGSKWDPLYEKSSSTPFYLEDGTGRILVDIENASVVISTENTYQGYVNGISGKWIHKNVREFINKLGKGDKETFKEHRNEEIKVIEYFIPEGKEIYVLGNATPIKEVHSHIGHENLIIKEGEFEKILYISDQKEIKVLKEIEKDIFWFIGAGLLVSALGIYAIFNQISN